MVANRFDVYLTNLDPTVGSEIQKTRPCLVISPDEMNKHIRTVIVAPMTTAGKDYPTRVSCTFKRKKGQIVLDQNTNYRQDTTRKKARYYRSGDTIKSYYNLTTAIFILTLPQHAPGADGMKIAV